MKKSFNFHSLQIIIFNKSFIDYRKAYDCLIISSINHLKLWNVFWKWDSPCYSYYKLIYKLQYRTEYGLTDWVQADKSGYSPLIYSTYIRNKLKDAGLQDKHLKFGGRNINNMRYADNRDRWEYKGSPRFNFNFKSQRALWKSCKPNLKLNVEKTKLMAKGNKHNQL